jgi:hypothetical protein
VIHNPIAAGERKAHTYENACYHSLNAVDTAMRNASPNLFLPGAVLTVVTFGFLWFAFAWLAAVLMMDGDSAVQRICGSLFCDSLRPTTHACETALAE